MYDWVFLPTDGSEGTAAAVDHVFRLAAQGGPVDALSVVDTRNRFAGESTTNDVTPGMARARTGRGGRSNTSRSGLLTG